jgi:hypothetical protein
MGNSDGRSRELRAQPQINKLVADVPGPTQSGQSRMLVVRVEIPKIESIHFETMYGKTKDVCGVASINSHTLVALAQKVTKEVIISDHPVLSGAFLEPKVPSDLNYLDPEFCEEVPTAIDCLRQSALPNNGAKLIRPFAAYLPSFLTGLEMKYGSEQVQSLVFPNSQGLQLKIRLRD